MAHVGTKTRVYVGPDDLEYNLVSDIRSVSKEDSADEHDTTKFGDERRTSLPGFRGGNITMVGYFNKFNDLLGQQVLWEAYLEKTEVWVKILWNGVYGERMKVRVSNFSKDVAVDSVNNLNITLLPQADEIEMPS